MTNIPRDAGFYYPSEHAVIRKRDRNISWEIVSQTIETGEISEANGETRKTFTKWIADEGDILCVVACIKTGNIDTMFWYRGGENENTEYELPEGYE